MLEKTLEFLRIVDPQPNEEKIRKRKESAQELFAGVKSDPALLADFAQGAVSGFASAPFSQDSPVVTALIKAIKDRDALPHDLKENAAELRALAGIVLGELLTNQPKGAPLDEAVLAALSLSSGLSLKPAASEKHLRWMLETLSNASNAVLLLAAQLRRKRSTSALQKVEALKKSEPPADVWDTAIPSIRRALQEVAAQAAIDREETETLWWLFAAYSELEQKPLKELTPCQAACSAGFELAMRALLPPPLSTVGMIRRAVETERKASTLTLITLQDAAKEWTKTLVSALAPVDDGLDEYIARYPSLLPLSWACRRLRDCRDGAQKLGKDFVQATGFPTSVEQSPSDWGAQIFREKTLQRVLVEHEES